MALIKDIYSETFYRQFADAAAAAIPGFNKKQFVQKALSNGFKDMEWKHRMKHTTRILYLFLSPDFGKAVQQIEALITQLRKKGEAGLAYIFFADYIETYGLDHLDASIEALEFVTQFISCEFAVRPFLLKYPRPMLKQMLKWSKHRSEHVRRLASEGSRPRLPWAMAIPYLKQDPTPVLPILENLKNDPSEYVRRSVANNLNDIAKDHPDTVIRIAAAWKGKSKETDAVIKHGSRTLLKQGHTAILQHYGLDASAIAISEFLIHTPSVQIGQHLEFSVTVANKGKAPQTVRLEYAVYYCKANGSLSKKVFKISERDYAPKEKNLVSRRQSFKLITTRTFYAGQHQVAIIVNGQEKIKQAFQLTH
ncbi:MAG: DNA alkylation repair protein [Candidatus Pseudobacter hemicellulosilyticus]|uniref:DNA alkylation repair protein n=1 Tax=Candidatus Pseudobacter hemicellulosilyticus TaxID=3121375 RepID=A0AAJ5WTP6_9BACT|nr:MAG: DNA alkylation repair protein [Pseudobacter sp.]